MAISWSICIVAINTTPAGAPKPPPSLATEPSADACPSPSLSLQSIHPESDDIDYHLYLLIK